MKTAILRHHIDAIVANPEAKKNEFLNRLKPFNSEKYNVQLNYLRLLVEKIFGAKTLTSEISFARLWGPVYLTMSCLKDSKQNDFWSLGQEIGALLKEIGYRENTGTRQEHKLIGGDVWVGYHPYKPIGVLDGSITIEEARKARKLEIKTNALSVYYGLQDKSLANKVAKTAYFISKAQDKGTLFILCESLNDNGETIRNPRPINKEMLVKLLSQNVLVEEAIDASLVRNWTKSRDFTEGL